MCRAISQTKGHDSLLLESIYSDESDFGNVIRMDLQFVIIGSLSISKNTNAPFNRSNKSSILGRGHFFSIITSF